MYSFFPRSVLLVFFSFTFADICCPKPSILSQQSWHENVLSPVFFRSSIDGDQELVNRLTVSRGLFAYPISDKLSQESQFAPWSYDPVCTELLEGVNNRLCVYTNASFSNGRGISIFTTPKIAREFAESLAFQNPTALDAKQVNVDSGSWYTQNLLGRGVGMLAKHSLKHGDRVTAYTPAFLAHLESDLPTMERERYWRIAIDQLPKATREMYYQLATVYGKPEVIAQDVVKANNFQLQVGGQNHLAIFPETSRLNHDCAPNAQYYLDPSLLTHLVHVTRPIAKGEEITISYTSPLEVTVTRQQRLSGGFHFACTCDRCSNAEKADAVLEQIDHLQTTLNDWSTSSTATPKLAEKALQLYRTEGLEGFLDIPYGFAALAYNAVSDAKKAMKYAKLAIEAIEMKDGSWTPNLQIWKELLQDPKKHWSWGMRKR